MGRFNAWFAQRGAAVRPTAGYVADGRRWLAEVGPLLNGLGIDRERLVRQA